MQETTKYETNATAALNTVMLHSCLAIMSKIECKVKGASACVANCPYHSYEFDLLVSKHLRDENDEMAILCIDACTHILFLIVRRK